MALGHDSCGREIPDQTPIEIPTHLRRPLTLQEEIKRFIRIEASLAAQNDGLESFEEADDFEIDEMEADDIPTPYLVQEQMLTPEPGSDSLEGTPEPTPAPGQAQASQPSQAPQESQSQ